MVRRLLLISILIFSVTARRQRSSNSRNYDDSEEVYHTPRISISDYLREPSFTDKSLSERKILRESLSVKNILSNHNLISNTTLHSSSSGEVLVYVTPWNKKGYSLSKMIAAKLDWIVPVWFRIIKVKGVLEVAGKQDVDESWLNDLQKLSVSTCEKSSSNKKLEDIDDPQVCNSRNQTNLKKLKVVPRVVLETSVSSDSEKIQIIRLLLDLQTQYHFHGFTLEVSLQDWTLCVDLLRLLKEHCSSCYIIFVLPPMILSVADTQTRRALLGLSVWVERFSVMTYDKHQMTSLPAAPLSWAREVMTGLGRGEAVQGETRSLQRKLLLGIPLYGWRGREAVTGDDMIVWLATGGVSVLWDEEAREHFFTNADETLKAYYPTPLFVKHRLDLAKDLGVAGVAFWELGQTMAMVLELL